MTDRDALLTANPDEDTPRLGSTKLRYCSLSPFAVKLAAEAANFRSLYLLELGIRRQNYNHPAVPERDEDALRAALPDAAIRFE